MAASASPPRWGRMAEWGWKVNWMLKNPVSLRRLKRVQMSLDFARDREPLSNGKAAHPSLGWVPGVE